MQGDEDRAVLLVGEDEGGVAVEAADGGEKWSDMTSCGSSWGQTSG